jgi:pyruvate carboxylase
MEVPITRNIRNLLVPNRGEIAQRILQAGRELSLVTYALTTPNDTSHARYATHTISLPSPAAYLDIELLISICKEHSIDAVHPGYGFLSESAEFAKRMWEEAGVMVVGPGAALLARTGDKIKARELASECGVPVLPALGSPTRDLEVLKKFAGEIGYPLMIKAVDGGGGRGIRLVRGQDELEGAARRAIEESPSKLVFAERAAVDGFLHVEVQIVGDGKGGVLHAFERQCSIQRRYQKVVEVAPCVGTLDRQLIGKVIAAAVQMAKKVREDFENNYRARLIHYLGQLFFSRNIRVSSWSRKPILFPRSQP